jgi:energy-converting hydrogenase B subunit D
MSAALANALDLTLCGFLIWLAWKALASQDLFRAIVLFIAFGFTMALAWVRLQAPDIALAEAAVGSGITGALLLAALGRMRRVERTRRRDASGT